MDVVCCFECKRRTEVVVDHASGDTICTACGLVLESHFIDETSEWRTFADDNDNDNDPVRVGGPSNPLLTDGHLFTYISKSNAYQKNVASLSRWQNSPSNRDHSLSQAFHSISTMADRLGLVATIKNRANEIYKMVDDLKPIKGRHQDAILAGCLYIACQQEDKPRTINEIRSITNGASKRDIVRAKEFIVKQLEHGMGTSMNARIIHAEDFLRRFCSHLGMNHRAIKAATESVKKSSEVDIRRSPISIAAAVIYMISQLSGDEKQTLKKVSLVTGVAEWTLRNSYKDLFPHVFKIVPDWFAKPEDLRNLCAP